MIADRAGRARVMDADLAIVGAGPVGLMLAGELCLAGVRPLVLERQPRLRETPKASGFNGQIVELRRGQDPAAEALRALFGELLADEQPLRRLGALIAGTSIRYPMPGPGQHALAGTFVPDLTPAHRPGHHQRRRTDARRAPRPPRPRRPPGSPRGRPGLAASRRHPRGPHRSPARRCPLRPEKPGAGRSRRDAPLRQVPWGTAVDR